MANLNFIVRGKLQIRSKIIAIGAKITLSLQFVQFLLLVFISENLRRFKIIFLYMVRSSEIVIHTRDG